MKKTFVKELCIALLSTHLDCVCFCCQNIVFKKIFLQINLFLVFYDCFDVLISKIILKNKHYHNIKQAFKRLDCESVKHASIDFQSINRRVFYYFIQLNMSFRRDFGLCFCQTTATASNERIQLKNI